MTTASESIIVIECGTIERSALPLTRVHWVQAALLHSMSSHFCSSIACRPVLETGIQTAGDSTCKVYVRRLLRSYLSSSWQDEQRICHWCLPVMARRQCR